MAARDGSTIEQSIEIDLSSSEDEGEPPAPPQPPSPAEQVEPEHCHFAVRLKLQGLGATAHTKPHAKPSHADASCVSGGRLSPWERNISIYR